MKNAALLRDLEACVEERGLSVRNMVEVCGRHGLLLEVFSGSRPYERCPYIMYDRRIRHYSLIKQCGEKVTISDNVLLEYRIPGWLFSMIWSGSYLSLTVL